MVGLFVQQHHLPFHVASFAENYKFRANQAESLWNQWFKKGKFGEPSSKGKISGFSEFIKSMKHEHGNSNAAEVQELLSSSKILSFKWKSSSCICIVMADGTIIYIHITNVHTGEFYFVADKFFRFPEPALSVAYSTKHVLFMFPDNRLLVLRKGTGEGAKSELIQPEVIVSYYNDLLPSLVSKKIEKQVCVNEKSDLFMVWWCGSKNDVFPWSPKPEQRANILIYSLDEEEPSLISFLKTDNILLEADFIPGNFNHVIVVEQKTDLQGCIIINEIIYEITRSKLSPACETDIPLQSEMTCHAYDERKRKLAIGCCDGSIIIYTQDGKVTHFTKASFIPGSVSWHNDGYIVFVSGDRGQFQMFDIALNPLLLLDGFESSPSLTKELLPANSVTFMAWCPISNAATDSVCLVRLVSGVMVLLRFGIGHVQLMNLCKFHLTNDHWPEAVKVLKSVYWNSDECLHCLYQIFTFLMQRKHSDDVEYNLEHLMATYFVPSVPIDDALRKRHSKSMRILARKFFMWLLQAKKFSRAFHIATSLGEEGLLRKLQIIATAHGELALASEVAKKISFFTVSSPESGTSTDSRSDSRSSYTTSSDTDSDIDDNGPTSPVSVAIPRPELLVLEPPSPYRNPTVEPPKPKYFYFGEKISNYNNVSSGVENALISDPGNAEEGPSTIEVINFGPV